jgi:hypothetical protein
MRATSFKRTVEPSALARSTMLPNCSVAAELAADHHGGGNALAGHVGQLADLAGRHLGVLRADGGGHVGGGQVEALQLGRVDPDAHGALGAEQLGLAHAGQALDLGQHAARRVVAQRHRVPGRVVGRQDGEQQEVAACLVHAHALLRHGRRQARRGARQAVLHIHLGQVGVGAGLEAQRDLPGAVGLRHGLHVDQAGRAVHLLLDHRQHAVFQRLGRGAGVGGRDHDGRRRHRRVLRDRQLRDGHTAPITMMNSAITHAKMGRSMKNLAMALAP